MDLRFYVSIFLRRLPWFLLMLAIGSAAGVTLARVLSTVFVAQALLVVESEQIPDALAASTVQTQATEQLQIIQQRILTRDRLLDMANRLQIYAPLPGEAANRPLPADEIVSDLRARIGIVTSGGQTARGPVQATLVRVSFQAPTAQLAANVANEVVGLILREDVAMRTGVARQTLDFFEQEVRRLDQELARQGAAVLAFKAANKTALPDSLDFRRSQQAAAQERLLLLDRQEAELRERRAQVERMKAAVADGAAPAGPNETVEQARLRGLRDDLNGALAILSPTHPRIRALEAQIAALDRIVSAQPAATAGPSGAVPMSAFDLQMAELDSQLRFLAANRAQVESQMTALATTIDATPPNAITLGTLERDYANLRAQYDDTVAKKARAETGDVIEALSKGQRISIIEQASPPRNPDRPNRPMIAAGGVGIGLALGIAMVLLLELLHPGIRRPAEITAKLGIAPFATLPYLRTRGEIRRRRAMIGGAMAVAVAGVPFGLWLVHTQYMPLDLLVDGLMRRSGLLGIVPVSRAG
ncbi:MAG: GumC family protein [Gemmobacter sp.]